MCLIMFTMVLMDSSMSLLSLSTCSWFSIWHIWHPWMLAFWKRCNTCIWSCSPWSWWTPPCPCSHRTPGPCPQDTIQDFLYEIYSLLNSFQALSSLIVVKHCVCVVWCSQKLKKLRTCQLSEASWQPPDDFLRSNKPCDEVSVAAQLIKRVKACKSL